MRMFKMMTALLATGSLALAACGGDGNPPTPPQTVEILSNAAFDGHVIRYDNALPTKVENSGEIMVGNSGASALKPTNRGFVEFDLSQLPQGAVIQEAVLELYQLSGHLGDPYGNIGPGLMAAHIALPGPLSEAHFDTPALATGWVLSSDLLEGPKQVHVKAAIEADLGAGRTATQFRLYFQNDEDLSIVSNDYVYIASTDSAPAAGAAPRLIVTYAMP